MLDGHGGHDLFGRFAGHRPENALTDGGMCGTDCVCGNVPFANGKDVRRRLDVEPADQRGEFRSVEVVDSGSGGSQLHSMPPLGSQVQIGPCDDVLAGVGGQLPQPKSPQYRTEADLNTNQFEAAVRAPIKDHIGNPCQPLANYVHDLGIEDVANEHNLVFCKSVNGRRDRECRRVRPASDDYPGVLEALYSRPGHQQDLPATA
ncbi:MAG: hypothetical protein QOJ24_3360 [Mycobacterium sp.]|jgi:hypothetical protein|nr:hypothetical protein [Mycobacterium sp.]